MLKDGVVVGSQLFHREERRPSYYDEYFRDKNREVWNDPDSISLAEVDRLILFLNQWASHYENSPLQQRQLLEAIRRVHPLLQPLHGTTLLSIDFTDTRIRSNIQHAFETIASCGTKYEATATSKILHTVEPGLFVMWDNCIRLAYAVTGTARDYSERFLPRMRCLALRAVGEYEQAHAVTRDVAIEDLTQCGHTLAKVLDEFNYAKYTLKRDEVWNAELELAMSLREPGQWNPPPPNGAASRG